ncbi:hypothetical protein J4761_04190 [Burkholderia pseudomallei]|uniref:hypothetical protein n=1 Tax=Burkholderia pseudomallei TaxID=28450 RepID=UPI001AAEF65B|nr:hypothetical protein [Burkholderia pseudomallei]
MLEKTSLPEGASYENKNSLATVHMMLAVAHMSVPIIWRADFIKLINLINGVGVCEQTFFVLVVVYFYWQNREIRIAIESIASI